MLYRYTLNKSFSAQYLYAHADKDNFLLPAILI